MSRDDRSPRPFPTPANLPLAVALATGLCSMLAGAARAEPPKVTSAPKLTQSPATFSATIGGRGEYQFEADLDSGEGSVSVARAGAELGLSFAVGDRSRLNVSWDSEFSWYDWKDASAFSGSAREPWEDTQQHAIAVQLVVPTEGKWAWFVGGGALASYEQGADLGDSMTYGAQGGARYVFSDAFSLSLGVGVRTRLEDDTMVLPIIGFDWKINEKLSLGTKRGIGLELKYQASDAVALTLGSIFDSREFRLRDDGAVRDGVGADRRVPVVAGIEWAVSPTVILSAQGGLIAWSHYKLEDDSGSKVGETDADPAGFIGIGVDFRF
jgi:hypothetical protein